MNILNRNSKFSGTIELDDSLREDLISFSNNFIAQRRHDDQNFLNLLFKDRATILSLASASLLELFHSIREAINEAPYYFIKNFPMRADIFYGATPPDWRAAASDDVTIREESFVALAAACLGETFSWPTLQSGRLIHNVLPIAGDETEQNGHSSEVELEWHTEDAFHPCRSDYLILFGIRNHDHIGTTIMSIRDVNLSEKQKEILFEKKYRIKPDNEHLRQVKNEDDPGRRAITKLLDEAEPVAVLFGNFDSPYIRIDPYFMECPDKNSIYDITLKELIIQLNNAKKNVVVNSGDMLIIDNYISVHGRAPFKAKYDGADRWLKKAIISRDIRKAKTLGFSVTENSNIF